MGRMRRKKNLLARVENCGAFLAQTPEENRGRWRESLGVDKNTRLEVEIGCGKGGFCVKTAQYHTDNGDNVFLLALDREQNALVVGMELAAELDTKNLLFVHRDASALRDIFAPGEADLFYINFCDPWPARRHERRRLTHPDFLAVYRALLAPGGSIRLKTDNEGLFLYSLKTFRENGWALTGTTTNLHAQNTPNITTQYEDRFSALGMPIFFTQASPESETPSSL